MSSEIDQEALTRTYAATNDIEWFINMGGIVHATTSMTREFVDDRHVRIHAHTVCMELGDVVMTSPYVSSTVEEYVTCQTCLEWLHA